MIEFLEKPLKGMDNMIFQVMTGKNIKKLSDSAFDGDQPNEKFSYVQIKVKCIDDIIGALNADES